MAQKCFLSEGLERIADLERQLAKARATAQGWLKENGPGGWIDDLRKERDALKAHVKQLSRPFSEAEVKEKWPEASLAEAGLANAMTLARLGLRAWTKDSIALTVAIDAARAALAEEPQKGQDNESNQ